MPLKFFVVCSGALGTSPFSFLLTVLLARVLRFGGESYLGVQMGEHSTRYLSDHARELAYIAVALFVGLYILIRLSDRWRKPAAQGG